MFAVTNKGSGITWRAVLTAGLLALTAGAASAQMTFDGNIMWDNNLLGGNTLANQFVGAPSASPDSNNCPVGYNAFQLGTVTFTHNKWADPLLPTAVYAPNVVPSFQPSAGSPAYQLAMSVPDPWFVQTC
jgi:hypothetical protein